MFAAAVLGAAGPAFAGPDATAPAAPATESARPLPPMHFYSSIADETVYDVLKTNPAFVNLDKDLVGAPLFLVVTHTARPTSGGAAAGALSGLLAGSTLGLIPIVTSEEFVIRYEVWMNGQPVSTYSFNRTETRAVNMWSGAADKDYGLGKGGLAWLKSTAGEFAEKALHDAKLAAIQAEIDYYFPAAASALPAPPMPPAPPARLVPPAPAEPVLMPAPPGPSVPAAPAAAAAARTQ